ncbi:MAG: hypothetical protein ABSG78_19290 [Verrucomicrobiota bacterium]|jgi:hypothetical protein
MFFTVYSLFPCRGLNGFDSPRELAQIELDGSNRSMISKTMIVLANSVKRSGRCLAGKEVVRSGDKWKVRNWIRPVATPDGGEVSVYSMTQALGHHPNLLEILEIPLARAVPLPDQPENWLLETPIRARSWRLLGHFEWAEMPKLLDCPAQLWCDPASGSRRVKEGYPRVMPEPASLYLVKPDKIESIRIWSERRHPSADYDTKKHRVVKLRYAGVLHECDIDDPDFAARYYPKFPSVDEPAIDVKLARPDATLVCVSVTGAFHGHHYKIAAAFFEPPLERRE